MPDGKVVVEFTSEEYKLLQGMRTVVDQWAKIGEGAAKAKGAAREAAREQEDWGRKAKQVFEETRTPLERFYQRYKDLNELHRRGAIDQETHARAMKRAGDEYDRLEKGAQKAGGAMKTAFGPELLGVVKNLAGSFLSVGSAIAGIKGHLDEIHQRSQDLATKQQVAERPTAMLAQLAETPEDMKRMVAQRDELFASGAAPTLEAASQYVFSIYSAGAEKEFDLFKDLGKTALVQDPDKIAKAGRTLQAAMGVEEAGTYRQLVSKAIAAAGPSPTEADEILEAAAQSGTGAKALGLTDEELLAATGIVSEAAGGAALGGTKMASLMRSLQKIRAGKTGGEEGESVPISDIYGGEAGAEGPDVDFTGWGGLKGFGKPKAPKLDLAGKDLMGMVRAVEAAKLDDATLFKLFGRQEAVDAYRLLVQNAGGYQKLLEDVQRAQTEDRVARQLRIAETVPEIGAARELRIAKAGADVEESPAGLLTNLAQVAIETKQARMRAQGKTPYQRSMRRSRDEQWLEWFGPEKFLATERVSSPTVYAEVQQKFPGILGPRGVNPAALESPDLKRAAADIRQAAADLAEVARRADANPTLSGRDQ